MNRRHILLIISSLTGGGAARVACELASFLRCQGCIVTLATLEGEQKDRYTFDPRVERLRINLLWDSRSLVGIVCSTIRRLWRIRRMVTRSRADLVISFIDTTNVRVLLSLIGARRRVVVCERTDPRHHRIGRLWEILRRFSYPLATRVVVQTRGVAGWATKWLPAARTAIIPNFVRSLEAPHCPERPRGMPPGPVIMGVGRLGPEKGFDRLIQAFANSGLPGRGWSLVLLGEGTELSRLVDAAARLGLSDRVVFAGWQEHPEAWLSRADLFALSSRYEGFPNVLIEAMQFGVASVAFDCESGPGEIIRHGTDGWLVPADDVEALGQALRMLGEDAALRAALGRAATSVSSRFSREAILGQWWSLCESVVAGQYPIGSEPNEDKARR